MDIINNNAINMNDEKLEKFVSAINKDAKDRRARILEETEKFNQLELAKAEEAALSEAYSLIQEEIADMRAKITRELSLREQNARRELLQKRAAIVSDVFGEAQKRLVKFTKSDEYPELMTAVLEEYSPFAKNPVTVYMSPDDCADGKLAQAVNNAFSCPAIESDPEIKIGGLRLSFAADGLIADETLDTRLEKQREWFIGVCGLGIM